MCPYVWVYDLNTTPLLWFSKNKIQHLYLPFLISLIYACSDEFHQLFIAGRAGQIQDVMIDSIGILIGFLIIMIYQKKSVVKK